MAGLAVVAEQQPIFEQSSCQLQCGAHGILWSAESGQHLCCVHGVWCLKSVRDGSRGCQQLRCRLAGDFSNSCRVLLKLTFAILALDLDSLQLCIGVRCTDRHMQVWLGRRVSPEHHSADWQALVDSPRPWAPKAAETHIPLNAHCKLVAARQRVTVASIVDCAAMPFMERLADRGLGACSTSHNKEAIAEELSNRFCLYWRHEDLHDAGACSEPL